MPTVTAVATRSPEAVESWSYFSISVRRFVMRHLLACVAVGLFLGADAPKDDVKKDNEKLQATWKAVTAQHRGSNDPDAQEHSLIFSGDKFSVKKGEETMVKGKFKIDSSKKPKEIDMEFSEAKRENL